ncbi:MAG: MgtC/SapB family protein [Anaerolineaceae bacterium]|jgi:putative Mg2+ transporter-C (MgtC) family protein|nr:MAG: MgtC/SapB family protein [Anaerolineaceae bacterium]
MFFINYQDLVKLGIALLLGGIIGAERERYKKDAGLRTTILITLGSTLFTILSPRVGLGSEGTLDITRIAASIVSGIGFLGAGVILQDRGRVKGLTTSATIWIAAAIGMACGAGEFLLAGAAAILTVIVLVAFTKFEDLLEISIEERTYEITSKISWEKYKEIKSLFKSYGLTINKSKQEKKAGGDMVLTLEVSGPSKKHDKVVQKILSDKEIKEYWF